MCRCAEMRGMVDKSEMEEHGGQGGALGAVFLMCKWEVEWDALSRPLQAYLKAK